MPILNEIYTRISKPQRTIEIPYKEEYTIHMDARTYTCIYNSQRGTDEWARANAFQPQQGYGDQNSGFNQGIRFIPSTRKKTSISYASQAVSEAEKNYVAIELESLAVTWHSRNYTISYIARNLLYRQTKSS